MLAWCQTEVSDELARMREPREVTDFSDNGRSDDGADAFEGLQGCYELRPR